MDPKLPPSGKSLCDIMDPKLAHSCGPMVNTSDYGPSGIISMSPVGKHFQEGEGGSYMIKW